MRFYNKMINVIRELSVTEVRVNINRVICQGCYHVIRCRVPVPVLHLGRISGECVV